MQGSSRNFVEIFNGSNTYLIPAYQRDYQWDSHRWQALISDVIQAKNAKPNEPPHWMGIFLISQLTQLQMPGQIGKVEYTVIDGQQRLVTLMLWLAALVHHAQDVNPKLSFDLSALARIEVQESDRAAFQTAIDGLWEDPARFPLFSHNILKAYSYFRYILWVGSEALESDEPAKFKLPKKPNNEIDFVSHWRTLFAAGGRDYLNHKSDVDEVYTNDLLNATLTRLNIYTLIHEPQHDESQAVVFDTLNGMRQELEPLDHVRNSLFVRIPALEGRELYNDYWRPAETTLRKTRLARKHAGKQFVYDYVISQGEKRRQGTIKTAKGAVHFNVMTLGMSDEQLSAYVKNNMVPAMLSWQVVVRELDAVNYGSVMKGFSDRVLKTLTQINDLNNGPTNPLCMHFVAEHLRGQLTEPELYDALFAIEVFVARQILGGRALSPLRSRMMDIAGQLDKSKDVATLKNVLLTSDWVSDEEIYRKATTNSYEGLGSAAKSALLRGIERSLSGPGFLFFKIGKEPSDYSIEHIYPQRPDKWLADLESWNQPIGQMDLRREALGNLTVVTQKHNKTVGNKRLLEKQQYPTVPGAAPPLRINDLWLTKDRWSQSEIDARSIEFVRQAVSHWRI